MRPVTRHRDHRRLRISILGVIQCSGPNMEHSVESEIANFQPRRLGTLCPPAPLSMSPSPMRKRSVLGPGFSSRPRPSGKRQHEARTAAHFLGADHLLPLIVQGATRPLRRFLIKPRHPLTAPSKWLAVFGRSRVTGWKAMSL